MACRWGHIQRDESLSRREERKGWLSSLPVRDPAADAREDWRDDPTAAELAELDREEREAA